MPCFFVLSFISFYGIAEFSVVRASIRSIDVIAPQCLLFR